mgnify:CR=1 FL=1
MNHHIITLEALIVYLHSYKQSIIVQLEIGFDTLAFANGLRASLRQDPIVVPLLAFLTLCKKTLTKSV